jgi:hypothetical protein
MDYEKKIGLDIWTDSSVSDQGLIEGSCKRRNDNSGSVKCRDILE